MQPKSIYHKLFEPISWLHLLGTDDYGRYLFTPIIIGARPTLFVTVLTLIAIVVIGVTLGLFAGYKKGWIEPLVLRFIDVGLNIPEFIIMIVFTSLFSTIFMEFSYLNYINKMG